MLGVAEHRRAELGVVAAHAVEHAGAVVQPVREDVDLGVLPGDEISVHPDEVGGLHVHCAPDSRCSSTALVACAVPASPPRSGVRRPAVERAFNGRFYSRRLAFQTESVPQHHRRGEEHRQRVGHAAARRCRAPSRARARTCPGRPPPERGAREHPDRAREHRRLVGEDVAEHVLGEDRVEVGAARRRAASRRCRRARARARCAGNSRACSSLTTSRHSREVSSTLALSTLVTLREPLRRRRPSARSARSPRWCSAQTSRGRGLRCGSSRRSRSRR